MSLKPNFGNLRTFLNQYKTFTIPYYQRRYVWSKPENQFVLDKFLSDIIDEFDDNIVNNHISEYFIGNFAVYKRNNTSLLDGQQRLSTLIILLAEISKITGQNVSEFYNKGHFVMNGGCILGEELEYFLFKKEPTSIKVIDHNCTIALAQRIIENRVRQLLQNTSLEYIKKLQNYILDDITLSYIEFENEKEGLKYFLNINSLSIQLTEMEIFLAFTSQVIAFTNTTCITIDSIKESLKTIDERLNKVSDTDLVFIFLNAYFKNDNNIGSLSINEKTSKTGIGKWLTGYKMDLLSDPNQAIKYINALTQYVSDIDMISTYFIGSNPKTTQYKFIWFMSIFNKYTKYKYLTNILSALFKNRHNYITDNIFKNIKGMSVIDEAKLDSFCKAATSVILVSYFRGDIGLLQKENKTDIKLTERTENKQNASLTIKNINYSYMWSLKYPRDKQSPKYPIADNGDSIFFILALQEAYLNSIANPMYNGKMVNILAEILDPNQNYQIEHLITKDDYKGKRLEEWQSQGLFRTPEEFDECRSKFENLSLLDGIANASANSNTIAKKLGYYKNAKSIMNTNEPEYLVQSLVDGSSFYENSILTSKYGERKVTIDSNGVTWKHSENNKRIIEMITRDAVAELIK